MALQRTWLSKALRLCARTGVLGTLLTGCASTPRADSSAPRAEARTRVTLTHLGVAGWQISDGRRVVLVDPYLSRPSLSDDAPALVDEKAVVAHVPAHADLVLVAHSHVDHLLDAPTVARLTGAQLIGSVSTARYARASGLAADAIVPVKGGEDYAFEGVSVRVIPSLHSALGHKHTFGGDTQIPENIRLPLTASQFAEGGTFAYLVRIGGHQIAIVSSANFIEQELAGIRPDIAIVATGLRQEVHDYTCRLMRVLGHPAHVFANHFDAWQAPLDTPEPVEAEARADLAAFEGEVRTCSPETRVTIPARFTPFEID